MSVDTLSFSDLLTPIREGAGHFSSPADWTQGRATFGGLVAAAGLAAMRKVVAADRPPRSLHISFVGPMAPGTADVQATLLREGRAVSTAEARIMQNGAVCTVVTGSFGAGRDSEVNVDGEARPQAAAPDECVPFPYLEGVTPAFTQHFEYRYAMGGLPFAGSHERVMGGWCRYRQAADVNNAEHVLGLVDAWPPTVLPMLTKPAPASSLTWSIQFLDLDDPAKPDGWWFYRSIADAARHGYAHTHAALWTPDGRMAALSTQTIAVFG